MSKTNGKAFAATLSEYRHPWVVLSVIAAVMSCLPYFILGENSIVTYHDQLDGELLTYMLNAKHLFEGLSSYPELMNGIPKNGMASPAPALILLFRFFKPFMAFVISMLLIRLVAVISMFLFLDELTDKKPVSFFLAVLFMCLPFYTVYGLSIPGQPILYYTYLRYKRDDWEWPLYFAIALYAFSSSFALCGFAVLGLILLITVVSFVKKEHPVRNLISFCILTVIYVVENVNLVLQALGVSQGFVSHKSEIVHYATPFLTGVKNIFWEGTDYTKAYQKCFLVIIALALIIGAVYIILTSGEKKEVERLYRNLIVVTAALLIVGLLVSFLGTPVMCDFFNSKHGIIHDFNFTRVSWLMPVLWIAEYALSLSLLYRVCDVAVHAFVFKTFFIIAFVASFSVTLFFAVYNSDLKPNLVKIYKHGDYDMMTWKQFFAEDLFSEVDMLIGRDKKDYRVVSLCIYPAAAAYNGFYCVDAYSNNYDVNYKHEFRDVISPQLERSEYLREWFDEWGNRCYLVLNESMNLFNYEKSWGTYTNDYDLNFDKLKEMGCEYIISAKYLVDCGSHNLSLLNEEAIENEQSWYRLFVYHID